MGIFDRFRRQGSPDAAGGVRPRASDDGGTQFTSLDDPALLDYLRAGGHPTESGAVVSATSALRNMAVLRAVSLISRSIGMLPLQIYRSGTAREKAIDHSLYRLLARDPNDWQTPFTFKSTMMVRALVHGDAYAVPVWSRGQVVRLFPLDPTRVTVEQDSSWSVEYRYTAPSGKVTVFPARGLFHLRDISLDGLQGMSRVRLAREAIGLALRAEQAAARLFRNGMLLGGVLAHPGKLSDPALQRLRESLEQKFGGAENAQRWIITEEGMKFEKLAQTAVESQHLETRKHQLEEVARAFDVPRPLLMLDETSWGSGIEQLALLFIQFGLAPWFVAWEEEVRRTLFTEAERDSDAIYAKFNERALLRGTLKDQADFFAKALGAGGQDPWMAVDEVRGLADLPEQGGASAALKPGYGRKATINQGTGDEPTQPA